MRVIHLHFSCCCCFSSTIFYNRQAKKRRPKNYCFITLDVFVFKSTNFPPQKNTFKLYLLIPLNILLMQPQNYGTTESFYRFGKRNEWFPLWFKSQYANKLLKTARTVNKWRLIIHVIFSIPLKIHFFSYCLSHRLTFWLNIITCSWCLKAWQQNFRFFGW